MPHLITLKHQRKVIILKVLLSLLFSAILIIGVGFAASHAESVPYVGWLELNKSIQSVIEEYIDKTPVQLPTNTLQFHGNTLDNVGSTKIYSILCSGSNSPAYWEFVQIALLKSSLNVLIFPKFVTDSEITFDPSESDSWMPILDNKKFLSTNDNPDPPSIENIIFSNFEFILNQGEQHDDFKQAIRIASSQQGGSHFDNQSIYNTFVNIALRRSILIAKKHNIDISSWFPKIWVYSLSRPELGYVREELIAFLAPSDVSCLDLYIKSLQNLSINSSVYSQLEGNMFRVFEMIPSQQFSESQFDAIINIGNPKLTGRLLNVFKRKKIFRFNSAVRQLLNDESVRVQYAAYMLLVQQLAGEGKTDLPKKVSYDEFQKMPNEFLKTMHSSLQGSIVPSE